MAQAVAVSLPVLYQLASFISLFISLFLCVGEANKIKIEEACQLMCDVIATNDGKQLFQAIVDQQKEAS